MTKPNDYPIQDCLDKALPLTQQGFTVHQKYTCKHCGSRQTMSEPNKFYKSGRCEECNQITLITHCNYLLISGASPNAKR